MDYGCQGLTVVISGGTSGIGLAAAAKFLQDGARVYLLGRQEQRGREAVAALTAQTGAVPLYLQCDITSAQECRAAVQRVEGNIDILVHCAGIYLEERLEQMTEESFNKVLDTNVKGTLLLTQAALGKMYGGGSIITIASDAGISGNYGCPLYCASKGAVVALTKALALDLAPHIRVNCICPADVQTPLLDRQLEACNYSYTVEEMAAEYPLLRIGRVEEIAHVICSTAAPANSFMTGSIIAVDGGLTAK